MGLRYTDETFKENIYNKYDNNFILVTDFIELSQSVRIKCTHCGNEKTFSPQSLLYRDVCWCDNCSPNSPILKQIKVIESQFPFKYSEDLILYLDKINYKIGRKHYFLDIHDNEGFKYQCEYGHINGAKKSKYKLARYFLNNPYTNENIQRFLNINNISITLLDEIHNQRAIDDLQFKNKKGELLEISWNEIQQNTSQYRDDHINYLYERKKSRSISKNDAIKIIYEMQSRLDRPLNSRDFRIKQDGGIGIKTILKYWKEVHFMQEELGLTITKYQTKLSHDECTLEINNICNDIYKNENRKLITSKDIITKGTYADTRNYNIEFLKDGTTLRDYLKTIGFELQKAGTGFNYIYGDGEKVVSMYEYGFSNYLRSVGLKYNKDYFRDVRYDKLTTEYKGNMNCDYEIHFQGRIFYVELAGILGNPEHDICYRNNTPIKSQSKEKYRLGLMSKKAIFEDMKLEHYILLPSEMNEENYKQILNLKEVA